MKCWICEKNQGKRKNRILDHMRLFETHHWVCDECYIAVHDGLYDEYSIIN